MSILSGFFKTKKYRKTDDGYKLQSEWTSSETVEMGDGNTVEENLGAIQGITSSLASTSDNYALSASAGKDLQDQVTDLNSSLNKKGNLVVLHEYVEVNSSTKIPLAESYKNYKSIFIMFGTSGDSYTGLEFREIPIECIIIPLSNQFCGLHNHYGLNEHYSEYQYGFTSEQTLEFLYVNNVGGYLMACSVYGVI